MINTSFIQGNNDNLQINTNLGNYLRRNNYLNKYFILLFSAIIIVLCYNYGFKGLLLVFTAILPSVIIIYILRKRNEDEMSISDILEFFTIGATFSVLLTIIIEGIILNLFFNQKSNCLSNDYFRIKYGCIKGFTYCSLITIIKYVISVGFIEESSKLVGLSTINMKIGDLNQSNTFFSHYINSNIGYVLSGISCSTGFATIENIAYLLNCTDNLYSMLLVSIARGVLSIPFHITASGYSSILLSKRIFNNNLNQLDYKSNLTLFNIIFCLMPTSILHGLYDASLVILMVIDGNNINNSTEITLRNGLVYQYIVKYFKTINDLDNLKRKILTNNAFNSCFDDRTINILTVVLLLVALLSLITCIILFTQNWINLRKQTVNRYIVNNVNIELASA